MSEVHASPSNTAEPYKVVLVDESKDARDAARDRADARLSEELGRGNGLTKFLKGMWKGGLAKEFYRQRYTSQAHREIENTQDVLIHEHGDNAEARASSMQATIEQFQDGADELIHTEAGEKRAELAPDSELAVGVKQLIRRYAEGSLNETTLREERTRLLNDYRANHGTDEIGEGVVAVDNMIQVAENVRGAVEHGESMDNIISQMQVIAGEARTGVRGEARYNAVDKIIDKISKTRAGSLVSPELIGVTAGIVAGLARWGSTSVAVSATKFILPGAAAGALMGLREGKRVEDERNQHGREMAQGKEFGENDRRRNQMEAARYSTLSATELTERLAQAGRAETLDGGSAALAAALDSLAEVQTRVTLSDRDKRDYISYSDVADVGSERMLLDRARAEVRLALEGRLTNEMRTELQLDPNTSVADLIRERSAVHLEIIQEDMTGKDRAFNRLKARRIAKAAAVGAVTSMVLGVAGSEALAAMNNDVDGVFDSMNGNHAANMADGMHHQTLLNGLIEGDKDVVHTGPSGDYDPWKTTTENDNGQIMLSDDHTLVGNDDGTYNFVDGNGQTTVENIVIDKDGTISDSSIDRLEAAGMTVDDYSFDETVTTTTTEQVTGSQLVENHIAETTTVTRDLWYGNDTPSPNYDQNELRVYRGGSAETPGLIDGGFQYTTAGMHADGSWQGGERVDWNQAAASGNLFFAVSATSDTQDTPFMIPIGPDGAINIMAADTPAAQLFSYENGTVVFHGSYGEVVQTTGVDADGTVHIRPLATMVGDQDPGIINDTVTTTSIERHGNYNITTGGYETTSQNFTEIPVGPPIDSRRALEAAFKQNLTNPEFAPTYYTGWSQERMREWVNENPNRLKSRRKEVGSDGDERWVEADGSPVERSVERERTAITEYLEGERDKNPEYMDRIDRLADSMGPMGDETRVAINVPAWMEEKNLYHYLNQMTFQTDADGSKLDPSLYEVNVIINRKTGDQADGSVDVIERFIQEYQRQNGGVNPRVNYIDVEIDPPDNNVGYARKMLTDAVALRSIRRTGQTDPFYIESEDADVVEADPRTVFNLIDKFDKHPELEALRGVQDRDPSYLKENDYLFMRRRTLDFFEILARQKRFRDPASPAWHSFWNRKAITGGWNTGYTLEAYANIGGYDSVIAAEDVAIGEKISMVRGDGTNPNLEVIGTVSSRSDSSPRRFIQEIITGKGAYDDFMNSDINKTIRERPLSELMGMIGKHARLDDSNKADFESFLRNIPRMASTAAGNSPAETEAMSRRIMFFLGFGKGDYTYSSGGISIRNWDSFKGALESYRTRYSARRARATA